MIERVSACPNDKKLEKHRKKRKLRTFNVGSDVHEVLLGK